MYQYPSISRTAMRTGRKGSRDVSRNDGVDQSTPPVMNNRTAQPRHDAAPIARLLRKTVVVVMIGGRLTTRFPADPKNGSKTPEWVIASFDTAAPAGRQTDDLVLPYSVTDIGPGLRDRYRTRHLLIAPSPPFLAIHNRVTTPRQAVMSFCEAPINVGAISSAPLCDRSGWPWTGRTRTRGRQRVSGRPECDRRHAAATAWSTPARRRVVPFLLSRSSSRPRYGRS